MNNENNNFNSNNLYYNQSYSYNNNNSNFNYNLTVEDTKIIKKWNWGAFTFNIWWGIGNKCYMPLLCLIPVINIVMIFACGACGNRWLWNTGQYKTPKEMRNVQKSWNTAGFISFILIIIIAVLYIIVLVYAVSTTESTPIFNSKTYRF